MSNVIKGSWWYRIERGSKISVWLNDTHIKDVNTIQEAREYIAKMKGEST